MDHDLSASSSWLRSCPKQKRITFLPFAVALLTASRLLLLILVHSLDGVLWLFLR